MRHRGYSLSGEQPVAIAALGYDDPSGIYLGASAIGVAKDGGPDFLGAVGNVGYARRIAPGISLDIGVLRAEYSPARRYGPDYDYTELYLGGNWRNISARAHFSPDYYNSDRATLYLELDGTLELARNWHFNGHVGSLSYLDAPPPYLPRTEYDWRVGVTRQFGAFSLFAEASGRLKGDAYAIPGTNYEKSALVFGASHAF